MKKTYLSEMTRSYTDWTLTSFYYTSVYPYICFDSIATGLIRSLNSLPLLCSGGTEETWSDSDHHSNCEDYYYDSDEEEVGPCATNRSLNDILMPWPFV